MTIVTLQLVTFVFAALLFTVWNQHVCDPGKLTFGMRCLVGSIAIKGMGAAWAGLVELEHFDLSQAISAIVLYFAMLYTFESANSYRIVGRAKEFPVGPDAKKPPSNGSP